MRDLGHPILTVGPGPPAVGVRDLPGLIIHTWISRLSKINKGKLFIFAYASSCTICFRHCCQSILKDSKYLITGALINIYKSSCLAMDVHLYERPDCCQHTG